MTVGVELLLTDLGFVECTGFKGRVWTNPDSSHMAQVWVYLSKGFSDGDFRYDATGGLVLSDFFKWWQEVSR